MSFIKIKQASGLIAYLSYLSFCSASAASVKLKKNIIIMIFLIVEIYTKPNEPITL
jgi:hypothetical protein